MEIGKRNYTFDFARSFCVLWIVGFWHLLNYLPVELRLDDAVQQVCKQITMGILACFTFLSGYFLKKYEFNSKDDVLYFYKKRFWRFYPLFALAIVSMVLCGSSIKQVVIALFGLSMIIPPPIKTLWYFSMIILFYFLTPGLKLRVGGAFYKTNIPRLCLILVVLVGGYYCADIRLVYYFPFYVLGLNLKNSVVEKLMSPYTLVAAILLFVGISFLYTEHILLMFVQECSVVVAILTISKLAYNEKIQRPVSFIAEASMCAYLFHRSFYTMVLILIRKFTEYEYMSPFVALLSLVMLFVVAYFVQTFYNKTVVRKIKITRK